MNNIRGVIFTIESLVKSAKPSMFSKNVLINPNELFQLIDKLNDAVNAYEKQQEHERISHQPVAHTQNPVSNEKAVIDAKKVAFQMKQEANEYADGVLSRLQLMITKLQTNVINFEKNILEGRKVIEMQKVKQSKGACHET